MDIASFRTTWVLLKDFDSEEFRCTKFYVWAANNGHPWHNWIRSVRHWLRPILGSDTMVTFRREVNHERFPSTILATCTHNNNLHIVIPSLERGDWRLHVTLRRFYRVIRTPVCHFTYLCQSNTWSLGQVLFPHIIIAYLALVLVKYGTITHLL